MRPRVKPALRRIIRDEQTLQYGAHPLRAVMLSGLTPAVRQWIDGLDGTRDLECVLAEANAIGFDEVRARALLDQLAVQGALHDAATSPAPLAELSLAERDRLRPDLDALDLASTDPDGAIAIFGRRRRHRVRVYGAGRVGAQVVALLAAAGIGNIRVFDPGTTRPCDVTPGGLTWAEVGLSREAGAVAVARRLTSGGHPYPDPTAEPIPADPQPGAPGRDEPDGIESGEPASSSGSPSGRSPRGTRGTNASQAARSSGAAQADRRGRSGSTPALPSPAAPRSGSAGSGNTGSRTGSIAPAPGRGTSIPGSTSSSAGRAAPGSGGPAPTVGKATPATGNTTPTTSRATPASGRPALSTGRAAPTSGKPAPSAGRTAPTSGSIARSPASSTTLDAGSGSRTRAIPPSTGAASSPALPASPASPAGRARSAAGTVPSGGATPMRGGGRSEEFEGQGDGMGVMPSVNALVGGTYLGDKSDHPDLVIFAPVGPLDGVLVNEVVSLDIPHLLVSAFEGHGTVGPLVVPGKTACLHCLDLTRRDHDPGWPIVTARLGGYPPGEIACDSTLAALVAAEATGQALAYLDGKEPVVTNGTLDVTPDWRWRRRSWKVHPQCRCVRNSPDSLRMVMSPNRD
ncbi:hypothetical protein [Nonomuraea phyllanthi]|uniref:hypothetical protein n=1 Tax=Nonomuraea phyllanthi TaxID=2219224 RepID=UPI00186AD099|nr:hypothetical protein [Nonomuraea phyllanthi]